MTNRKSNVSADSIFRIADSSVLRSPMPRHISSLHSIGTTPSILDKRGPIKTGKLIRPTPIVPALGIPTTRKQYDYTSSSLAYDKLKRNTTPEKFSSPEARLPESNNDFGCEKKVAKSIPARRQSYEVSSLPNPLIEDGYRPEKGIYMTHWHLRCISARGLNLPGDLNVWVVLKGIRKYKRQWKEWHSSAIVDRVESRVVQTLSGQMYYLAGEVIADLMIEYGFSSELISRFSQGFPSDWKALLALEFGRHQSHKIMTMTSTPTKPNNVVNFDQDRCTEDDLSTKSPPREISDTSKDVLSKDLISKAEPIIPSPEAVIVSKDVIAITRSGRRIKRPGAWWAYNH
ncbi:8714_t:CDS:2 [Paraglomus brasilianum]|uniref:8714_t:CDS:1 n=1 Tax=Paraglomus brasilianum TaxID=144538 RepID=A0A9N9DFI1_9GLOM|nr:8714_t:CDS:2 [Paraglomus brasilianum]